MRRLVRSRGLYARSFAYIYIYIIMIVLEWIEFRFIAGEAKMIEI